MTPNDSNAPFIDFDHLNTYTGGDPALNKEILILFRSQIADWGTVADPALSDREWKERTHTLKGAARGVGSLALAALAERAETLTGPDMLEPRKTILAQMATEIARVHEGINDFLAQCDTGAHSKSASS